MRNLLENVRGVHLVDKRWGEALANTLQSSVYLFKGNILNHDNPIDLLWQDKIKITSSDSQNRIQMRMYFVDDSTLELGR